LKVSSDKHSLKLIFKGAFKMSYYTQKLKEIRQTLQELHSVPVFEPIKWKRMNSPIYTNCYAYCLNLDVTDPETIIFVPGCISNEHAKTNIMNLSDLINNTNFDPVYGPFLTTVLVLRLPTR